LEPGVISKGVRAVEAHQLRGKTVDGDKVHSVMRIALGEMTGSRIQEYSLDDLMYRSLRSEQAALSAERRNTGRMKTTRALSDGEVARIFNDRVTADVFHMRRVQGHMAGLEQAGVSRSQIAGVMKDAGFSKESIQHTFNGVVKVWTPSKEQVADWMKAANHEGAEGWPARAESFVAAKGKLGAFVPLR
jgi:hypothetical protein